MKYSIALLLTAVMVMVTGCERRPLEVMANERVRVKVITNWRFDHKDKKAPDFETDIMDTLATNYFGGKPNGMTLMLWGRDTGDRLEQSVNGNSVMVSLRPDTYYLVIFNDSEDDFNPYMNMADRDKPEHLTMRLNHYAAQEPTRAYYGDRIYYPEPICVAIDTFEITRDMLVQDTTVLIPYEDFRDGRYNANQVSEQVYEIREQVTPMTVTLFLKAKVKHRQSMKRIEASISGLADGFYMAKINRTQESATIELDPNGWKFLTYGEEKDSMGIIANQTATFGLPYGKELLEERLATDNVLSFRILLGNDSIQECSFNVGKDIHYLTPEGREAQIRTRQDLHDLKLEIDLSDVITLPPVTPGSNSGAGFDAWVDQWEDGGTFEIGGF